MVGCLTQLSHDSEFGRKVAYAWAYYLYEAGMASAGA